MTLPLIKHNLRVGLLLIISSFLVVPTVVQAANPRDWRAGNIIDDSLFYDNTDFSTTDIQNFLNARVPNCDTNGTQTSEFGGGTRAQWGTAHGNPPPFVCVRNYLENPTTHENNLDGNTPSGALTAAQIIKGAADTYHINPKVLIVLLQKEQTLITDTWPLESQYKSATGYGCPDTAPCDAEYYGFYNQVMNAAKQFRRYAAFPNDYRYKPYQNNTIQFNPSTSCGSSTVYIENLASAGLYNYTPYQPNAAALSNLYGGGDSCSAYGNRNFWRLFTDWFGMNANTNAPPGKGGGQTTSWYPGRLDVFVQGTNGSGANLYHKWFSGGRWFNWELPPTGTDRVTSAPASIGWQSERIDLFARGVNGDLVRTYYDYRWSSSWESLGGSIVGAPSVSSWSPGRTDIFVQGNNSTGPNLFHKWFSNGRWFDWELVPVGSQRINSTPTAVSWSNGRIDLFARGENGDLVHAFFDQGWHDWESLGGSIVGAPAVSSWAPGRLDIFAEGTNGTGPNVYHKWFGGSRWFNWELLPTGTNRIAGTPSAVSWSNGRIDLFARGEAGDMLHNFFDQSWHDWDSMGGSIAP